MMEYKTPLEPGGYYHIYNRANGYEVLFRKSKNCDFFLKKFDKYITPIADTIGYCLMTNHFHLLLKLKEIDEIKHLYPKYNIIENFETPDPKRTGNDKQTNYSQFFSRQFGNLLSSYTQSYNKLYGRMGSLFIPKFKRKEITSEDYFRSVLIYIHLNPVKDNLVEAPSDWKYSSYNSYLSNKPSRVNIDDGLSFFDGLDHFKYYHLCRVTNNEFDQLI